MGFRFIHFLFCLVFIISCSSKINRSDVQLFSKNESQSKPQTIKTVFDSNYLGIQEPLELEKAEKELSAFNAALDTSNLYRAIAQHCKNKDITETQILFCETITENFNLKYKREPRKRSSLKAHQIRNHFKKGDLDIIKEVPVNPLISSIRNLKSKDLSTGAQKIMESSMCLPSEVYLGTGSVLENHLPDDSIYELTFKIFEKSMECSHDEYSDRSAYRYSMLKISKGDCISALPALDRISKNNFVPYLHSRALYWKKKCEEKENVTRQTASIYQNFPLTYHGLTSYLETEGSLFEAIAKNDEPEVIIRVQEDNKLNQLLLFAEYFISKQRMEITRRILKRIIFDYPDIASTPQLGLYVSYLLNKAHIGLDSFKILAQILSQNPQMKTPTTMKLFYPSWYKDLVFEKAKAKNLDPALVLALIRQESAFTAHARSPAGAVGLMQLMPSSARAFDRSANRRNLVNEEKNVTIGVRYFARLLEQFDNNVAMALASYNAGRMRVVEWQKRYTTENELLFIDLIPYRETREYVASILRNWYWYQTLYPEQKENPVAAKNTNP